MIKKILRNWCFIIVYSFVCVTSGHAEDLNSSNKKHVASDVKKLQE